MYKHDEDLLIEIRDRDCVAEQISCIILFYTLFFIFSTLCIDFTLDCHLSCKSPGRLQKMSWNLDLFFWWPDTLDIQ